MDLSSINPISSFPGAKKILILPILISTKITRGIGKGSISEASGRMKPEIIAKMYRYFEYINYN
jgi:hypothetical protein